MLCCVVVVVVILGYMHIQTSHLNFKMLFQNEFHMHHSVHFQFAFKTLQTLQKAKAIHPDKKSVGSMVSDYENLNK